MPRQVNLNPNFELKKNDEGIKYGKTHSNYIINNENDGTNVLVTKREAFIWKTLRRDSDLENLAYKYFQKYRKIGIEFIDSVIYKWTKMGIVLNTGLYDQIGTAKENKLVNKVENKSKEIFNFEINLPFLTWIINKSYKLIFWRFLKRNNILLLLIISTFLNVLFIGYLIANPEIIGINIPGIFVLTVLIFSLISLFLHEMAHGILMNHFGFEVVRSGIKIYYGLPTFFVDSSEIWLKEKKYRIMVSAAGVVFNWFLSGMSFLLFIIFSDPLLKILLLQFGIINLTYSLLNLIPFVELDGYYIAIDIFDTPELKKKSMNVLKKFLRGETLEKKEFKLFIFSILSLFTFISLFAMSAYLLYSNYSVILDLIK